MPRVQSTETRSLESSGSCQGFQAPSYVVGSKEKLRSLANHLVILGALAPEAKYEKGRSRHWRDAVERKRHRDLGKEGGLVDTLIP